MNAYDFDKNFQASQRRFKIFFCAIGGFIALVFIGTIICYMAAAKFIASGQAKDAIHQEVKDLTHILKETK